MKHLIKQVVPASIRPLIRRLLFLPKDTIDTIFKRRDPLLPPRHLFFVGDGDFQKTGEEFVRHFTNYGNLKPGESVLDVGCGVGRMAIPLTKYLSDSGCYEGFDIVNEGIVWCQKNITPKFTNFNFQHAKVYNKTYNPRSEKQAYEYRFPYDDSSFDFVFLTSVFTHMLPAGMENYLSEIVRVLKPGGRSFITYFLLNSESDKMMRDHKSRLDFKFRGKGYWTTEKNEPESAVAFEESKIRNLYKTNNLKINEPMHFGSWCGRTNHLSYQDIVIAVKTVGS